MKLNIDWCDHNQQLGCIEHFYPGEQWETIDVFGGWWAWPQDWMMDQSFKAGAETLAYGSDGQWFALKQRK